MDVYMRLIALAEEIKAENAEFVSLFKWYDGPLVTAMKRGELFLIDEISLGMAFREIYINCFSGRRRIRAPKLRPRARQKLSDVRERGPQSRRGDRSV